MWITWQSTSRACTVSTASTALPVFETIIQQRSHAMRAHMLCTIVTLREEKRTNAENLGGSAIDGGTSRRLAKGDWVMVPEKTPHWFTQIDGTLVLMSIHLPQTAR